MAYLSKNGVSIKPTFLVTDYNGMIAGQGDAPIQPEAREALHLFARESPNHRIGIATGRSYTSILRHIAESDLLIPQVVVIVAEHGSVIYDLKRRTVSYIVSGEPTRELKEEFNRRYTNNGIRDEGIELVYSVEILPESRLSTSDVKSIWDEIIYKKPLPLRVNINGNFVEAVDNSLEDGRGSGKESALGSYFEQEGITWGETIYTGDGLNDHRPLKRAGIAGCPSNAHPENKELVWSKSGLIAPDGERGREGKGMLWIINKLLQPV